MTFVQDYYVRAGALLAALWQLPPAVSEVIIHHQHDDPDNAQRDVTLNVQAARHIAEFGLDDLPIDMLTQLNFYPEDVAKLEVEVPAIQGWAETLGG